MLFDFERRIMQIRLAGTAKGDLAARSGLNLVKILKQIGPVQLPGCATFTNPITLPD